MAIIASGKNMAAETLNGPPLMYEWHGKKYLGAAHGIAGILFVLIQVNFKSFINIKFVMLFIFLQSLEYLTEDKQEELQPLICVTLDFLLDSCFPSGNFPSSIGNNTDRLVHWCHGAPAFVPVLCSAFKVLPGL